MGLKLLQEELATLFSATGSKKCDSPIPPLLPESAIDAIIRSEEEAEQNRSNEDVIIHTNRHKALDILHLSKQILGSATNAIGRKCVAAPLELLTCVYSLIHLNKRRTQ